MGPGRKQLQSPSGWDLPGWKLDSQACNPLQEPPYRAPGQRRWGMLCLATFSNLVGPVKCTTFIPLGWMCSPWVLRHHVLSHKETKWWATSGYITYSCVSGLSSIPLTPDVGQGGFIAEARGTSHAIDVAQIALCVTGNSMSSSGQPLQAVETSTGS